MRILPITNTQIYSNNKKPYQSKVSFQAIQSRKTLSSDIFKMQAELESAWNNKEKYIAIIKKYAQIDINSRNEKFDTLVTKAVRERNPFLKTLADMESRGEIEGIDWNITDKSGDNLLMIAVKSVDLTDPFTPVPLLIKLANEGKIDVNYVNETMGYSLPELIVSQGGFRNSILFALKNIDVTKTDTNSFDYEPILKLAIKKAMNPDTFFKLACHPSLDILKCDVQDLFRYIDAVPSALASQSSNGRSYYSWAQGVHYKDAIETAIKVNNARTTANYYRDNGSLTLEQIIEHVDNVGSERVINLPLNKIGETIAHFLAETPVDPKDEPKLKDLINKMRRSICYFWKEDELGRSPLMLALENENLIVARAMLEKMYDSELMYISIKERGLSPHAAIPSGKNHIPILWNLIADLDFKDRQEFGALLFDRIKYGQFR